MPSGRHNITAIIYDKRGRPLSIGKNSYVKTHPFQKRLAETTSKPEKIYIHAEISAIIKCKNLERAVAISIFRYTKDGKPALAAPCEVCQKALKLVGINNVRHT